MGTQNMPADLQAAIADWVEARSYAGRCAEELQALRAIGEPCLPKNTIICDWQELIEHTAKFQAFQRRVLTADKRAYDANRALDAAHVKLVQLMPHGIWFKLDKQHAIGIAYDNWGGGSSYPVVADIDEVISGSQTLNRSIRD